MAVGVQSWLRQRPCSVAAFSCGRACRGAGLHRSKHNPSRQRCSVRAQHPAVTLSAAHPAAGNSIAVAEALDSPLSLLALMAVPIGIYFMFKILLWDYTSRRTDDPNDPDRRQSFSLSARPGPGIMPETNPTPPVRHVVLDPALQAMATKAAHKVADAVRQAQVRHENNLEMGRKIGGDIEEERVQLKREVHKEQPASLKTAWVTIPVEQAAELQARKEITAICKAIS